MARPDADQVVNQFLGDVVWGDLDYLLVDLRPAPATFPWAWRSLSLMTGAVIVMTPQDVAASIAVKSVRMFQKLDVPILGIVENMSTLSPRTPVTRTISSGTAAARTPPRSLRVPFLGEIPLDIPPARQR